MEPPLLCRVPGARLRVPNDAGPAQAQVQEPAQVPLVRERRELMSTIYEITVVSAEEPRPTKPSRVHSAKWRASSASCPSGFQRAMSLA